ncbi:MAG: hypothetical protein HOJ34_10880 [Kordiimonadaceae bacterium]|jgi:hypothetical protein|nr:hypothetical protein [Kordiimonadaceae bacterium]MBT6037523.1 hypothetical protein [Kordiimonadaceae bacterium]MBT6330275.1 hypothetical protein [Kordiimonadaceae bacterium]MBT7582697.1 hypothetical protein [Kordiimonadaceae bacterium]
MKKCLLIIVAYFLIFPPAIAVEIGEVAPDFVGRDFNGDDTLISDYRGQIVVLLFWINSLTEASNNTSSGKDASGRFGDYGLVYDLNSISNFFNQKGGGKRVKFIASSFYGPFYKFRREVRKRKDEVDIHYTNDSGHRISAKYFNRDISLPVAFVINQRGEIAYRYFVYSNDLADKISDNINTLLKQN